MRDKRAEAASGLTTKTRAMIDVVFILIDWWKSEWVRENKVLRRIWVWECCCDVCLVGSFGS